MAPRGRRLRPYSIPPARIGSTPPAQPVSRGRRLAEPVVSQRPAYTVTGSWLFHQFGAGAFVSPLGIGVGAAASLTRSVNLRVAGNFFNYNATGTTDGVSYKGVLNFRSVQASFDWFPWHKSFHLSPGVLFYNQNQTPRMAESQPAIHSA